MATCILLEKRYGARPSVQQRIDRTTASLPSCQRYTVSLRERLVCSYIHSSTGTITLTLASSNGTSIIVQICRNRVIKNRSQRRILEHPDSDGIEAEGFKSLDVDHPIQEKRNTGEQINELPNRKTKGVIPSLLSDNVFDIAKHGVEEPMTRRAHRR